MSTEVIKDTGSIPLLNPPPPQTTTESPKGVLNIRMTWETALRRAGYIPFVSSFTGPCRACVGVIGVLVNAVCIPIFAALGKVDLRDQAFGHLKDSARWILRGCVEFKPFIGNSLAWSWDSLNSRLEGKNYLSDALYECRFIPLLSMITGAMRSIRGAGGAATGAVAMAVFKLLQIAKPSPETEKKILVAHKFAQESLLEIPQGAIEMIPLGDDICPPLAQIVQQIEQQKRNLWLPPHTD